MRRLIQRGMKLTKEAVRGFFADHAILYAAAISFYAIISLAPLVVIVVSVAGMVYGRKAAAGETAEQIESVVGREAAELVEMVLNNASGSGSGVAAVLGTSVLLFSASAVFTQLSAALNAVFGVRPKRRKLVAFVLGKLTAIGFVLGLGVFVMLSLASGALVGRLQDLVVQMTPGLASAGRWAEWSGMVVLFTLVFALVFRVLPAAGIRGFSLWSGALVTSFLFNVGRYAAGVYLGNSAIGSSYGAAGSLLVLLMWIYYSAMAVLLGAEFTKAIMLRRGERLKRSPEGGSAPKPAAAPGSRKIA